MALDPRAALTFYSKPLCVPPFLSVDPGKALGWAEWLPDGRLVACGLTDGDAPKLPHGLPLLVIEKPHEGKGKATKGDLMKLSRRMERAIMTAGAQRVIEIFPVQWKGSVPKTVKLPTGIVHPATDEILGRMTVNDHAVLARAVCAPTKRHNIIDAIGIGIWYLRTKGVRP